MTKPTDGLKFGEAGELDCDASVSLETYLAATVEGLSRFLARMDACERTESGDYQLASSRSGTVGGARVLWHDVTRLATSAALALRPARGSASDAALVDANVRGFEDDAIQFPRSTLPLLEALLQLTFAIPENETGDWKGSIPATTVSHLRALLRELEQSHALGQTHPLPELGDVSDVKAASVHTRRPSNAEDLAYEAMQLACTEREDLDPRTPGPAHHEHLLEKHPELLQGKARENADTWCTHARKGRLRAGVRLRGIRRQPTRSIVRADGT